jgi:hypothetical protein
MDVHSALIALPIAMLPVVPPSGHAPSLDLGGRSLRPQSRSPLSAAGAGSHEPPSRPRPSFRLGTRPATPPTPTARSRRHGASTGKTIDEQRRERKSKDDAEDPPDQPVGVDDRDHSRAPRRNLYHGKRLDPHAASST